VRPRGSIHEEAEEAIAKMPAVFTLTALASNAEEVGETRIS
jgi:hypothetical protein